MPALGGVFLWEAVADRAMTTIEADPTATRPPRSEPRLGFEELLLIGIGVLIVAGWILGIVLFVFSTKPLTIPEAQPAMPVVSEDTFQVGTSRVQNWGERIILVVRRTEREYYALQGTSPTDGCILRWDAESQRVVSPCNYIVYNLSGNVVTGLTTESLQRYSVSVRDGVVYLTRG
jgi:nitrite reductase/ring-hydroxylating ferredoxin subunit